MLEWDDTRQGEEQADTLAMGDRATTSYNNPARLIETAGNIYCANEQGGNR